MFKNIFLLCIATAVTLSQPAFSMEHEEIFFLDGNHPGASVASTRPNDVPEKITLADIDKVPALANFTAPVGSGPVELGSWHTITLDDKDYDITASISRTPEIPSINLIVREIIANDANGKLEYVGSCLYDNIRRIHGEEAAQEIPEEYHYPFDLITRQCAFGRSGYNLTVKLRRK